MEKIFPTNKRAFQLKFKVFSPRLQKIRIIAYDADRPETKYSDRVITLNAGENRELTLKFPRSPSRMGFRVNSLNGEQRGIDDSSLIKVYNGKLENLAKSSIWQDAEASSFLKFAADFSERCGYMGDAVVRSDDSKFTIKYMMDIYDQQTKRYLTTPARIGHTHGIIEVSKRKFKDYTVPMRLIILLHEFSHKYRNQKVTNRPIEDEVAADINALYIYLAAGYPRNDAWLVFKDIFYANNTPENQRRLRVIEKFIQDFDAGKVQTGVKN